MFRVFVLLVFTLASWILGPKSRATLRFMPDSLKKVVIIRPTGEMIDNLPEMEVLSDTTKLYKMVIGNIDRSFISEFLDLYFMVQIYLRNNHKLKTIQPAYLALTENQGGFAKFGFFITQNGERINMNQTPYVDITVGQATASIDRLMSFTQLYPHELGHVFFHMLSPEDSVENNTKSVNMHFFSIITDYSTAFNEGFAEHIENVSRTFETNESIKSAIGDDIEEIRHSSQHAIKGFEKDFRYPFRLGFYKASMLSWYQKFEDYKRHEHAFNGDIRYLNSTLELRNVEDHLTYRNSGVRQEKNKFRNTVQLHATE